MDSQRFVMINIHLIFSNKHFWNLKERIKSISFKIHLLILFISTKTKSHAFENVLFFLFRSAVDVANFPSISSNANQPHHYHIIRRSIDYGYALELGQQRLYWYFRNILVHFECLCTQYASNNFDTFLGNILHIIMRYEKIIHNLVYKTELDISIFTMKTL